MPFLLLLLPFLLAPFLLLLLQLLRDWEPERGPGPPAARPPGLPARRGEPVTPAPGARPRLRAARAPLGPHLDLDPDAGRGVPSVFEPCSWYQCRSPTPNPICLPVGLSPQPGNWEVCAGTACRGCEPRRGLLRLESWRSLPFAGDGGGGPVLRPPAGVPCPRLGASGASPQGNVDEKTGDRGDLDSGF